MDPPFCKPLSVCLVRAMIDRIGEIIAAACIMALPYLLLFIGLAMGY